MTTPVGLHQANCTESNWAIVPQQAQSCYYKRIFKFETHNQIFPGDLLLSLFVKAFWVHQYSSNSTMIIKNFEKPALISHDATSKNS